MGIVISRMRGLLLRTVLRATLLPESPALTFLLAEPLLRLIRPPRVEAPSRILVLRLDGIGDVVLTSPLLRELKQNHPTASITLVVDPRVHNLVELCPHVEEVLTFDWRGSRIWGSFQRQTRALLLAKKALWKRRFDVAILPRWDDDTFHAHHLAYLSGARRRVGNVRPAAGARKPMSLRRGLLTERIRDSSPKHEVERNLDVLRSMNKTIRSDALELWLDESDDATGARLLGGGRRSPSHLFFALGIGAGAPKREWPIEHFVQLGEWLIQEMECNLVVVGSKHDGARACFLEDRLGPQVIHAAGKLTLRQTGALLRLCDLFIGNDSGPMHIAAAGHVPVVEISCHPRLGPPLGPHSPVRFGPWRVPSVVVQPERPESPCLEECLATQPHCILGVAPADVQASVEQLLRATATSGERDTQP